MRYTPDPRWMTFSVIEGSGQFETLIFENGKKAVSVNPDGLFLMEFFPSTEDIEMLRADGITFGEDGRGSSLLSHTSLFRVCIAQRAA